MSTDEDPLLSRARAWLDEDAAGRDVTAQALVPPAAKGVAEIRAKEHGVLAGMRFARAVFDALDAGVSFDARLADGAAVAPGDLVARVDGPFAALLAGERVALNLLQRASGVATHTARFVAETRGTGATVLATRKTTPGLRDLDIDGVRAGGGDMHRLSLADRVLVKENHLAAARQAGWAESMADVVTRLTGDDGPDVPLGVEVTNFDELRDALTGALDVVLLDNLDPDACREAVAIRDAAFPDGNGPQLEASGGVTLATVRAFAESGVERISVGALTHSAPALDLSMKIVLAESGA